MQEVTNDLTSNGVSNVIEELIGSTAESNSVIAITLLRIYDVLMCQYGETNPKDAMALVEVHAKGQIRGSLPHLDLTDE